MAADETPFDRKSDQPEHSEQEDTVKEEGLFGTFLDQNTMEISEAVSNAVASMSTASNSSSSDSNSIPYHEDDGLFNSSPPLYPKNFALLMPVKREKMLDLDAGSHHYIKRDDEQSPPAAGLPGTPDFHRHHHHQQHQHHQPMAMVHPNQHYIRPHHEQMLNEYSSPPPPPSSDLQPTGSATGLQMDSMLYQHSRPLPPLHPGEQLKLDDRYGYSRQQQQQQQHQQDEYLEETSSTHSGSSSMKKRQLDKGSMEYLRRRERNNIAVRKSREKSKVKIEELQVREKLLTRDNVHLEKKCSQLQEELAILRSLFSSVSDDMQVVLSRNGGNRKL